MLKPRSCSQHGGADLKPELSAEDCAFLLEEERRRRLASVAEHDQKTEVNRDRLRDSIRELKDEWTDE